MFKKVHPLFGDKMTHRKFTWGVPPERKETQYLYAPELAMVFPCGVVVGRIYGDHYWFYGRIFRRIH
jgi:hypothetical protein